MSKWIAAWVVLVSSCPGTAFATDAAGKYTILGNGTISCGQWIDDRKKEGVAALDDESWLQGYLTAFNKWAPLKLNNVAKGTDRIGYMGWMDQYCATHPLDAVADATEELIAELLKRLAQRGEIK